MKKIETALPGVLILEPQIFSDHRGYFMETWSTANFANLGINVGFVQDNQSFTVKRGTIRGIHFQIDPMAQAKLVRVIRGAVMDVVVDLRKGSPTYRKWISVKLTADNKLQLFIPKGFGHGFITLTDNVDFIYRCDNLYVKEFDRGVRYDDPTINIKWGVNNPILSEKDIKSPWLNDSDCNFIY